jgi:hypothetical protein
VASAALIPAHCPTSLQQNHGASQNPAPLSVANPAVLELSLVELPPLSEQMLSYFSLLDGLIRLFLYILTCIGISACMPLFLKKKTSMHAFLLVPQRRAMPYDMFLMLTAP